MTQLLVTDIGLRSNNVSAKNELISANYYKNMYSIVSPEIVPPKDYMFISKDSRARIASLVVCEVYWTGDRWWTNLSKGRLTT